MQKVGNIYEGGGGLKKVGNIYGGQQAPQQAPQPAPQPAQQSFGQKVGNFVRPMWQAAKETGAAAYDVGTRFSPLEGIHNLYAGAKNVRQGVGSFKGGIEKDRARQTMYEKVSGQNFEKPEGGLDWQTGRKFIGRAAEAPTYLYAGTKGLLGNPAGGLGSRILSRSTAVLPEAAVNTGLQQFEEGSMKGVGGNLARNAAAMALFSNVLGEGGRAFRKAPTEAPRVETSQAEAPRVESKPLQEGGKTRGLVKTIQNSEQYSSDMAKNLDSIPGYSTRKQAPIVKDIQKKMASNIGEVERIATTEISDRATIASDELMKHFDNIAQEAKKAGDTQTFEAAMSRSRDIAMKTPANLTEAGRAISAANRFNQQSPEGMLRALSDISRDKGVKLDLTNEQVFNFQRKAEDITKILDPRERALATFELLDDVYANVPSTGKDKLYEALNLPRAMMATADLSAPLRQGLFTAARHPVMFTKNFGKMIKYAFSEKAYKNAKADIVLSPNYEMYVKHKLPLTEISTGLTGREEAFISQMSENIPGFGKIARGSNRAYVGFLNKMRTDLFDDLVNTAKLNNIDDPKFFDDAARFVGSATGRGDIAKLFGGNQSGKVWASFFFSPRLMSSRMSLMNPMYYAKLHPAVRKEALKSLVAFVGSGLGILGLAKANGAEVGTDPRSADFGKIKVGNTRYDTWGGFQQYARLIGQLVTGEKISTITGKETTLGEGYNAPTRESIIMDFFKSKEAPLTSFLTRAAQGERYGEAFNLPVELIDRFIPMVISDAYDLYREKGVKGLAMGAPAPFGVGLQTYGDQVPMMAATDANNPTVKWRGEPSLGEDIYNKVAGKEVSDIPKDLQKQLYEERLADQKRQAEVDKAKQLVLLSGEPQQVGDTYIYLKDGIVTTKKQGRDKRTPVKDQLLYEEIQRRKTDPYYK